MKDELDAKSYARCKACNGQFYPQWNKITDSFEDMCWKCVPIAMRAAFNVDRQPDTFVEGYVQDKQPIIDTDDDYHSHGEDSMGQLDFFDHYEGS
jgi:hypothetical protein